MPSPYDDTLFRELVGESMVRDAVTREYVSRVIRDFSVVYRVCVLLSGMTILMH